jgi:serine protease AprX
MGRPASPALSPRRRPAAVVAAACAVALLTSLAGPLTAAAAAAERPAPTADSLPGVLDPGLVLSGQAPQRVVVSGTTGSDQALRRAVLAVGGTVGRPLPLVDGLSAAVPAARLRELAGRPGVRAVTADRAAALWTVDWDDVSTSSAYAVTSSARAAWPRGRGKGIGVAVLDTGISPHPELAGRTVFGPDLSGEGAHQRDSYGHGTVMAGAIAGNGISTAPAFRTGIAPRAHVVSIKVAGANGATDVSTVLAGMHWAASFRDVYNIRVLNLSWGVPSTQHPAVDPLSMGVQRLWALGITVVVAAGNSGPNPGTVTKPGDDPLVLTVGAYDDRGDTLTSNDVVPKWSSQGPTAQGVAKPDVVAPGRTLVLARAAGSTVELNYPKALVAPGHIKGSGSSQAAAVVSGAAAVMLSARPTLTPDQIKAALMRTASPMPNIAPTAQGRGRIDIAAALQADVSDVQRQASTATGSGSLDASRGSSERVQVTCGGTVKVLDDETTAWCEPWSGLAWKDSTWSGLAWKSDAWSGLAWKSDAWSGLAWKDSSWSGLAWKSDQWTGLAWKSADWSGLAWKQGEWTTASFGDDDLFLTGFWGDNPPAHKRLPGEISDPHTGVDIGAAVRAARAVVPDVTGQR